MKNAAADDDDDDIEDVRGRDKVNGWRAWQERASSLLQVRWVKCLWCASGLVLCFLGYGLLQERLMTRPFPSVDSSGDDVFGSSEFLVAVNRVVAVAVALLALRAHGEPLRPQAGAGNYVLIAGANTIGAFCQYDALKYVSFPAQTLAKCAKMLPVLVAGSLLKTRQYSAWDWLYSLLVGAGCALFILTDPSSPHGDASAADWPLQVYGVLLLLVFLWTDGFTSSLQERLFQRCDDKSATYNQMLYNNLASLLICLASLLVRGQLLPSLAFCRRHPSFLPVALLLSACAAVGQMFIYYTIKELGALFYSVAMVTRQLISVILSCLVFFHPLIPIQIAAAAFVFILLYIQSFEKKQSSVK